MTKDFTICGKGDKGLLMNTARRAAHRFSSLLVGTIAATLCIPALSNIVRAEDLQSSTATNCKQVLDQWGIIDVANDGTITSNVDLSSVSQVFNVNTINQLFCIGSGSFEIDTSDNSISNVGVDCRDTSGVAALVNLMHARYVQVNNLDFNDLTVSEATVSNALRWRPIGNNGCQFMGEYDGNSKKISNLYFNAPTLLPQNRPFEAVGLFGSTGDNTYKPADTTRTHAVIKNIILDDITMIGFQDVGGVVGIADANTTINNVSVSGTIGVSQTGYGDLGGIVGWTNGGDGKPIVIQNSKVDIQFQVITPDTATTNLPWCAGGIVGYADWTQVSDSQSDLTVDSQIINGVAGLMGCQYNGSIDRSFSTGNYNNVSQTHSTTDVAGLVSSLANTSITDSYSVATLTGNTNVAGLVNWAQNSTLTRTFAATTVNRLDDAIVGGLIASQWGTEDNTVQSSFWDMAVSNATNSEDGGTGKITSDLKTISTYANAGWDIVSALDSSKVWGICAGINNGYPVLQALTSSNTTCSQSTPSQDSGNSAPTNNNAPSIQEQARNRKWMESRTKEQFKQFTPAQLAAMPLSSIRGITTTHAAVMTRAQLLALTPMQIRVLRPNTLAKLPGDWLSDLTTAQIKAMLPRQIKALSEQQIQSFTSKQQSLIASVMSKAVKLSR
jgi:hypothetical protein